MSYASKLAALLLLLPFVLLFSSCTENNDKTTPEPVVNQAELDWNNPDTIDPYSEDLLETKQVDSHQFAAQATRLYTAGDYENAARYYLAAVHADPSDANSLYNLACCYGLLGRDTFAAAWLERAVKAGFENLEHINNDPDFNPVRSTPVFTETMATITTYVTMKAETKGIYVNVKSSALFRCRVHLPSDYDKAKPHRLVVGLHGFGDNLENYIGLWRSFASPDIIFASPQAPYPFGDPKNVGYSWFCMTTEDVKEMKASNELTIQYVVDTVRHLKSLYNISEVYLMGFSQGASYTLITGLNNPGLFDGLIVFGGWFDRLALNPNSLTGCEGMRIFIAHGDTDTMVSPQAGREAYEILKNMKCSVLLREFSGGHVIDRPTLAEAEEWMAESKLAE